MKKLRLIFILLIAITFACERKSTTNEASGKKVDRVKKEIDVLVDSMDTAWKVMIQSDNEKLADIKRLLDEVSYTKKYDVLAHDSLVTLQKKLTSKRYDQKSMSVSQKIDAYDLATDSLIRAAVKLTGSTPNIESHPLAQTLLNDIMEADNKVVVYRTQYDRWAREFNNYVEKHDKQLEKLGEPYKSYEKRPLFSLGK